MNNSSGICDEAIVSESFGVCERRAIRVETEGLIDQILAYDLILAKVDNSTR